MYNFSRKIRKGYSTFCRVGVWVINNIQLPIRSSEVYYLFLFVNLFRKRKKFFPGGGSSKYKKWTVGEFTKKLLFV